MHFHLLIVHVGPLIDQKLNNLIVVHSTVAAI